MEDCKIWCVCIGGGGITRLLPNYLLISIDCYVCPTFYELSILFHITILGWFLVPNYFPL